ncbi:hypothetical protein [Nocardioides baculatus]|jgi:hypothetical protein|uniref:Uncharacterized protein n=1 Tax=Nocardioides baculatus TaxID=2801337 RepID=A0ABS1L9G4_9ACTN|nr:hypothetical protein [Nocardioides baculatus]MBL0748178.1 hypothetical protein [Nocardioides baculatus]
MTTFIAFIAVLALASLLVSYARHDRFAGPSSTSHPFDELGLVEERRHLVPRT